MRKLSQKFTTVIARKQRWARFERVGWTLGLLPTTASCRKGRLSPGRNDTAAPARIAPRGERVSVIPLFPRKRKVLLKGEIPRLVEAERDGVLADLIRQLNESTARHREGAFSLREESPDLPRESC